MYLKGAYEELARQAEIAKKSSCIDHGKTGDARGYSRGHKYKGRTTSLHRVVYMQTHGINGLCVDNVVMHACDNPRCINPDHLFLATQGLNMLDCRLKDRHVYGTRCVAAKLNDESAMEIYMLATTTGMKTRDIAAKYGVSDKTVLRIRNKDNWKHIHK